MTNFDEMSPSELRKYAKDNSVDLTGIDSRRKTELVKVLAAAESGETYTPGQEVADRIVAEYKGAAIDDSTPPEDQFDEADEPAADVQAAFDQGEKGVTAAPQSTPATAGGGHSTGRLSATVTEPAPAPAPVSTPEPQVVPLASREQLEVADLVGEDNRVRTAVNMFPTVVNGKDMCRLMLVDIPGESDTLALVWWRNTSKGPVQQAPITRVAERSTDPETGQQVVTTASGGTVTYRRSKSCPTCGNRLANWRPWKPPVRVVQVAKR